MFFPTGLQPALLPVRRAIAAATASLNGLALVASVLVMLPVTGVAAIPLTLAEVEDQVRVAEPGQQALQAKAEALLERGTVASQLPDPMLRVALNNYPVQSGNFSTEGMTNVAIGLMQTFPAGKSRSISERRYQWLASEMQESAEARGRNVLAAARQAWLELYYWEQAYTLVSESRPYFDDLATITRSLYAVGRKNQQDVLRAELELSRLDDRLIEIERQRARARAMLGEWIGLEASRPVAPKLPDWNEVPALESMREALQQHPSLRAAEAQIDAQSASVDLANERSKPNWALDLGYSYRDGYQPSGESRADFVSVGVTVGLPFFRRKSIDSNLSAALQDKSAAVATREQTLRGLDSTLAAEYARWNDLARRLAIYDSRVLALSSSNAEASLLAYQSDQGDFANVMRAYVDDLNTRIDYIRLKVERAQSYAMLANLGGL
ncbi:MAG: TolC family protein [Gammaproteobacteria bacterium]|nr:TolC family protein [Gammaproteobacteria bacterium]